MQFGLDGKILKDIKDVFSKYDEVSKVILYGSRAKGTYKNGSDIFQTSLRDFMIFV